MADARNVKGSKKSEMPIKELLEGDRLDLSGRKLLSAPMEELDKDFELNTPRMVVAKETAQMLLDRNLPQVKALILCRNRITQLTPDFSTLRHLTELDLSKNSLVNLPDNFGQLSNLRRLDLHGNPLKTLPHAFWQLSRLEWLDLRRNKFENANLRAAADGGTEERSYECAKRIRSYLRDEAQERERRRHMQVQARVHIQQQVEQRPAPQPRNIDLNAPTPAVVVDIAEVTPIIVNTCTRLRLILFCVLAMSAISMATLCTVYRHKVAEAISATVAVVYHPEIVLTIIILSAFTYLLYTKSIFSDIPEWIMALSAAVNSLIIELCILYRIHDVWTSNSTYVDVYLATLILCLFVIPSVFLILWSFGLLWHRVVLIIMNSVLLCLVLVVFWASGAQSFVLDLWSTYTTHKHLS